MPVHYGYLEETMLGSSSTQLSELISRTLGSPEYREPWSSEKLAKRLLLSIRSGVVVLAFSADGRIIGAALGFPTALLDLALPFSRFWPHLKAEDAFYCAGLFVSPFMQSQGIGTELVRRRQSFFFRKGFASFVGMTNTTGGQLALYRRLGYQIGSTAIQDPSLRNPKFVFSGKTQDLHADLVPPPIPLPPACTLPG
ncbi:GNAT family N-acetyltransferase [Acanthopleuribacter pedis]|uniref:GNAT family N-acetyltransferase n=1 Tax=Acanthopleuribacter pedis TaxID=442870 RepID=A0A8J7QHC5_9BACT|nr:GNAT family N-acetyltransferase [Acanthopleuribacter pedis]MBO1317318.1 GNAT family N-acetyltransferase [Acanthopleuribacter pedis]MBO1318625.1 GNAT family N-acetyltransferase [Acanthopleuribacter pedis]